MKTCWDSNHESSQSPACSLLLWPSRGAVRAFIASLQRLYLHPGIHLAQLQEMTVSRQPARSREEISTSGCYKCGGNHFHKDRHTGFVCQGKRPQRNSDKNSNFPATASALDGRSFADAAAQRTLSQDLAAASKSSSPVADSSSNLDFKLIFQVLQQLLALLSAANSSVCQCKLSAAAKTGKAEALCSSLAVVCSDAQGRLNSSTSSTAPKAQAPTASKPVKNSAPKNVKDKAVVPQPTDSLSIFSQNKTLLDSKAPTAPLLQSDSKMSSLTETAILPQDDSKISKISVSSDTPSLLSLSGDQPVTSAASGDPVDVDLKAGSTAQLPKNESKRSTSAAASSSLHPDPQPLPPLLGDPPVTSAAAVDKPALSPRAERRRRQKEHKGAASDELLRDYQETLVKRGPDRDFEAKHDLFVAQQVQFSKSRGVDLAGVLARLWVPCGNFPTFFSMGVFNRELIGVAFHANSVDQAFKRAVDFRARVGKLAALRSASC